MFGSKIEKDAQPAPEQENDPSRKKVLDSLKRVDLRESLHEDIFDRLILLEKESKFNEDSRRIERGMENVLSLLEERYAKQYPEHLSKEKRMDARKAAILHDIGKSGPIDATPEEQEAIVKIFACENIRNPEILVEEEVAEIFNANQIEAVRRTLEKYDIGGETTMRQFWDKHAYWTHDILEQYPQGLSEHTRIIAGSHHTDHGVNPYNLPEDQVPLAANIIGTLENYIEALEGRALIVLDQYEASIRRSGLPHKEALSRVRNTLVKYANDELLKLVFDAIDELEKDEKIFS